jgi:hypothetical protein
MLIPSSATLAQSLLHAPGWARVGLAAPSQRVREKAAVELAETVLDALEVPPMLHDDDQMALPL